MTSGRASTPSTAARSRASTAVLDISDRGTPAPSQQQTTMTPPASDIGVEPVQSSLEAQLLETKAVDQFKPYSSLMETEITLVYGKKLKQSRTIHQELLCCHSDSAQRLFKGAEALREAYSLADDIRRQLKELVYPRVTDKTFDDEHMENKATPLIVRIYENYPLVSHRKQIQQIVDDVVLDQVAKRHVTAPQSKSVMTKKDLKGMGIRPRLQNLQSKGVLAVAQLLSEQLRHIKRIEKDAARTNKTKAAAQKKIVLQGVEERTVTSLVHWTYCHGSLAYDDPEHLYKLHALALTLDMKVLVQQCLSRLSTDTESMLEMASSKGLTLQQVLGFGSEAEEENDLLIPTGNVVQVVFQHVLEDERSPKRLVTLVTRALTESLEPSLWEKLKHMINHRMSLLLIEAMLAHRQVKDEVLEEFLAENMATHAE